MSKLKILTVPDPMLRQQSKPVQSIDKKAIKFIKDMGQTLVNNDPPGVGLSAVQVGHPDQIFLTYMPEDKSLPMKEWDKKNMVTTAFINPEIVDRSKKITLGNIKGKPAHEGCLSIPGLWGPVPRNQWVRVKYQTISPPLEGGAEGGDPEITSQIKKFDGFQARVVQHEFDHLKGVLFTDYTLKENLPLYFDEGEQLVEIADPKKLINW